MAVQFHIANSAWVKGVGIIAGAPYYCAQGSIDVAETQCTNEVNEPLSLETLNHIIAQWEYDELVDPIEQVKDARVWLLQGAIDSTVHRKVGEALRLQYQQWVDAENVEIVDNKPFGHHFPSLNFGVKCGHSASPFIGNCEYDAAGALLTHLYTDLAKPDEQISGKVFEIDQSQLAKKRHSSLGQTGYLFLPEACQQGEACRLHVSFHDCKQSAQQVGMNYVTNTGLNRWADDNNIAVLYPQTKKSLFAPMNPKGCWDWWGYTDANYATKRGRQISTIRTIITNLTQNITQPSTPSQ